MLWNSPLRNVFWVENKWPKVRVHYYLAQDLMALDIHTDLLENYGILSSSVCQAWWYLPGLLPYEDQWGRREETVWANPRRLFREKFSTEAHPSGTWPSSLQLFDSHTSFIYCACLGRLYKETSLNIWELCKFQGGTRFGMLVFFFGAAWFRAVECLHLLSPWIDCTGAEASKWGRHDETVLYGNAVLGAFYPTI